MQNNELNVETVTKEEDVQIYKVEGLGIAVTFTNSTKTGRLYIDGKGSRKHREKIINAVIDHDDEVTIGKPSRVSLPYMITIKNETKDSVVTTDDYIKMKLKELKSRGFNSISEEAIIDQLHVILDHNNFEENKLNEIGREIMLDIIIE